MDKRVVQNHVPGAGERNRESGRFDNVFHMRRYERSETTCASQSHVAKNGKQPEPYGMKLCACAERQNPFFPFPRMSVTSGLAKCQIF